LIRRVKQLWMWITIVGQIFQKLRHVVTRIKMRQAASRCAKTPFQLGFRKQVESVGGFVEEHYATDGKQVKSSLERALGPTSAFGQRRDLAKVLCNSVAITLVSENSTRRKTIARDFSVDTGALLAG